MSIYYILDELDYKIESMEKEAESLKERLTEAVKAESDEFTIDEINNSVTRCYAKIEAYKEAKAIAKESI